MDMELLFKEFGVENDGDLYIAKTTKPQVRLMSASIPPVLDELTEDECKTLCEKAGVEYLPGYASRVLRYIITDETPDRYGDIVRAAGVKFANYFKNPVIQFAHDYSCPPVGNTIQIGCDKGKKNVAAHGLFMDDRVDTSGRSDLIFRMAQSGFMRACSIGFKPLKYNRPDGKEAAQMGLGNGGVEYTETDLMEWSPCAVPANPSAIQDCVKTAKLKAIHFEKRDFDAMKEFKIFSDENTLDKVVELIKKTVSTKASPKWSGKLNKTIKHAIEKPQAEGELSSFAAKHGDKEAIKIKYKCGENKLAFKIVNHGEHYGVHGDESFGEHVPEKDLALIPPKASAMLKEAVKGWTNEGNPPEDPAEPAKTISLFTPALKDADDTPEDPADDLAEAKKAFALIDMAVVKELIEKPDFDEEMIKKHGNQIYLLAVMSSVFLGGGLAVGRTLADFDIEELKEGIEHEEDEHVIDCPLGMVVAAKFAMDHLTKDPEYYDHLDEEPESDGGEELKSAAPAPVVEPEGKQLSELKEKIESLTIAVKDLQAQVASAKPALSDGPEAGEQTGEVSLYDMANVQLFNETSI